MTAEDVARVVRRTDVATVVAVHMEAINHCLLGRAELRSTLGDSGASGGVLVPEDGETVRL